MRVFCNNYTGWKVYSIVWGMIDFRFGKGVKGSFVRRRDQDGQLCMQIALYDYGIGVKIGKEV